MDILKTITTVFVLLGVIVTLSACGHRAPLETPPGKLEDSRSY